MRALFRKNITIQWR
jgi:hypothetical protein